MIEGLLTAKQWLVVAVALAAAVGYMFGRLLKFAQEARKDRATLAVMLVRIGNHIGIDLTKDGKQ